MSGRTPVNTTMNTTSTSDAPTIDITWIQPVRLIVALIFLLTAMTGICLNASIIFVLYKKRSSLMNPTNCFLLTLTVLDFLMSLVNMPMVIVSSFVGTWVFGYPGCVFYGFTMTFLGLAIISVLTMISFDQYIVMVKKNLKHKRTRRVASLFCVGCVCWGVAWAVGPLVGWNSFVFTLEDVQTSCAINWKSKQIADLVYTFCLFVFCFLLPFGLICFFYSSIYKKVNMQSRFDRTSSIANRQAVRQRYISTTIFYMIGAFVLSWSPYAIVVLWSAFGEATDIPSLVAIWPAVFAKISVIWNPLIYTYRNREMRKAWREIFARFYKSPSPE